jgi:hypothetical protein
MGRQLASPKYFTLERRSYDSSTKARLSTCLERRTVHPVMSWQSDLATSRPLSSTKTRNCAPVRGLKSIVHPAGRSDSQCPLFLAGSTGRCNTGVKSLCWGSNCKVSRGRLNKARRPKDWSLVVRSPASARALASPQFKCGQRLAGNRCRLRRECLARPHPQSLRNGFWWP